MNRSLILGAAVALTLGVQVEPLWSQDAAPPPPPVRPDGAPGAAPATRPVGGGRGMFGGGGPTVRQDRPLVKQFDKNGDGWLNREERVPAREAAKQGGGGRGGMMGGGRGGQREPAKPGPKVAIEDVQPVDAKVDFYDASVLRTIFLEFENADWELEMQDFRPTDVDVPALMTVDGKKYPNVGVGFRGASSYGMVPAGYKRSLNITTDMADKKQKLLGYKSLNLLNANGDPTFMRGVLYSHIARQYTATPKANLVRVVINGESWGLYVNQEQVNKDFLTEWFKGDDNGDRWKVPGRPGGQGGLAYLGDDVQAYKAHYAIKTKDDPEAWKAFIAMCKTLNQTPADKLEAVLKPILDVDRALWFLALENVMVNSDGYWTRASDYNIYRDKAGKFHVIPHDINETFSSGGGGGGRGGRPGGPGGGPGGPGPGRGGPGGGGPGGPGGPGGGPPPLQAEPNPGGPRPGGPGAGGPGPGGFGMGGGGIQLDPFAGSNDPNKPLLNKLLQVPAFRARYLSFVRTIAEESLDYVKLEPVIEQYRKLIEKEVEADTRRLSTFQAFQSGLGILPADAQPPQPQPQPGGPGFGPGGGRVGLKQFIEQRRAFLLNHPEVKKAELVKPAKR